MSVNRLGGPYTKSVPAHNHETKYSGEFCLIILMLTILIIISLSMSVLYLFDRWRSKAQHAKKFGESPPMDNSKAKKYVIDASTSPKKPEDFDLIKKKPFEEKRASFSQINVTLNFNNTLAKPSK